MWTCCRRRTCWCSTTSPPRLQVGDQVPIETQSATSILTPGAPVVNSIEYRDTGVILNVTPRVNAGGLVLLDIAEEVSDVMQTTSSNLNTPTISQRRVTSSVAVRDGQTIALGGLIKDTRTKSNSGIPVLKDIPYLGWLFGTQERRADPDGADRDDHAARHPRRQRRAGRHR